MSDKQMYDILGKFNNVDPKLARVTDKEINQPMQETPDPKSLKGQIQHLEEKYMGFKKTVAGAEAAKRKEKNAVAGIKRATKTKEVEQIDELSKKTKKEGLAGAALGGVAGAALTKSPQGAMTGARVGSSIQDKMFGEGSESPKEYAARMHRLAQRYRAMTDQEQARLEKIPGRREQFDQALEYVKAHPENKSNMAETAKKYEDQDVSVGIRVEQYPYGKISPWLKAAVNFLNRNGKRHHEYFDYPEYADLPDEISSGLMSDEVDFIQDHWDEVPSGKKGVAEGSKQEKPIKKSDWFNPTDMRSPKKQKAAYLNQLSATKKNKNINKQGVTEGYSLKKTKVEKTFTSGDPDEYYSSGGADVTTKDTDYEIINNKTGQVVGTASWTTNDYFGPGALKITMHNGATRWLDIWDREKGNPQTAFNRFVKDPKTAKKYKDQGVSEGKVKDLSMDLRELSEAEFKKKYGKTKAEMRKSLSEARELKNKEEFDRSAKIGDYYRTAKGGKVIKTARGYRHEQGHKKEKDDDLDESVLQEKSKSKAQQKFMGMVYAAKKGEKPASPAVAKAAKGMSKTAAKDFAKTKHQGLPQHVNEVDMGQADARKTFPSSKEQQEKVFAKHRDRMKKLHNEPQKSTKESVQMNESQDLRKHPIYTTQEAWDHYVRELEEQERSAMETSMTAMEEPLMDADQELDEIARLAGLAPLPKEINIDKDTMAGKGLQKSNTDMVKLPPAPPEFNPVLEGSCNMTAEGQMCPEHGLAECGMYSEDIYDEGDEFSCALGKPGAPVREDDSEEAVEEGNEFTKARLDAIKAGKDSFTVGNKSYSVTGDTSGEIALEESLSVNINATDEDVVGLMQRLAGLPTVAVASVPMDNSCGCEEALEEERDIEWDNTPEERTAPISAAIPSGTGMHRSKMQDPHTANKAANPLAETEDRLWKSYERMLKAIKD